MKTLNNHVILFDEAAFLKVKHLKPEKLRYAWELCWAKQIVHFTETELILKSRWVKPAVLLEHGFGFKHATIDDAVQEILGKEVRGPRSGVRR